MKKRILITLAMIACMAGLVFHPVRSAQHDMDISNADANTGLTIMEQISLAMQALATNSSGAAEPGTAYPYQFFFKTSESPVGFYIRKGDETGWVKSGYIDNTTYRLILTAPIGSTLKLNGFAQYSTAVANGIAQRKGNGTIAGTAANASTLTGFSVYSTATGYGVVQRKGDGTIAGNMTTAVSADAVSGAPIAGWKILQAILNSRELSTPKGFNLKGIAYGNSVFVAVGAADGVDSYIVTSSDGITWTERAPTVAKNVSLYGVTFGNNLFVAVGDADGADAYIVTSSDGITWTERANPANLYLRDVIYAGGQFVAVGLVTGSADDYIITSSDGITWTERANPHTSSSYRITYGNGIYVAVGGGGGGLNKNIITSPDGITWTERTIPGIPYFGILRGVAYGNGLFVVVGDAEGVGIDSKIVTSPDGITWTERTNPLNNISLYSAIYCNGIFVVGIGSPYTLYSVDGITWTQSYAPNINFVAATYGNGVVVGVTGGGLVDVSLRIE